MHYSVGSKIMTKYYKNKESSRFIYKVEKLHYTTYDLENRLAQNNSFGRYIVSFENLNTVKEITKSEFGNLLLSAQMGSHVENITMKSKIIRAF